MSLPLIFLGTTNLDIAFYSHSLPTTGQSLMGTIDEFGGGKGANQAVAAARLGAAPHFATLFGEDDAADILIEGLTSYGVQTSKFKRKAGVPSGKSLIFVGADGSNMIGIDAGANESFGPDDVENALNGIPEAAVMVVEMGLPVAACRATFEKKGDRFLVFNPAPVRAQLTDEDYRAIDLLTPNETEAEELTGIKIVSPETAFDAAKRLHDRGVKAVAITLGEDGVVYFDAEKRIHQLAYQVNVVDTTAAGDAFNGAVAVAIARKIPIEEALIYAVACASISVTRKGAQQSMPTEQEVRAFLTNEGNV